MFLLGMITGIAVSALTVTLLLWRSKEVERAFDDTESECE